MALIASSGGDFLCPTCGCVFRHNTKKWFVVLPLLLAVSVTTLYFGRQIISPAIGSLFVTGIVALIVARMPSYVIVTPPYHKNA